MNKTEFLKKINLRKRIVYTFFLTITIGVASFFFISTVSETLSMGKQLLGAESYNSRMNDSFLYTAILLLVIGLPAVLFTRQFFNRYTKAIQPLTNDEMARLIKQDETSSLINKYLPQYIITARSVKVFKAFYQLEILFKDMEKITIKQTRPRYGVQAYYVNIKTASSSYIFLVDRPLNDLIDYALIINPNIIVS